MNTEINSVNREKAVLVLSGWVMLPVVIILMIGGPLVFIYSFPMGDRSAGHPAWGLFVPGILMAITGIIFSKGFFSLQPNEARVLILFGEYKGTVRQSGFWWGNPFYSNGTSQGLSFVQMAQMAGKMEAGQGGRHAGGRGGAAKPPSRNKMSLRARTLNGERLKVNDKRGNPIEIAAIVI